MTDAFKSALREFRDDLDRLRKDLENAIVSVVGHDEYIEDDILDEKDDGSTTVDVEELKALFARLNDASEAAADAFQTFDQEVERVWRRFKQTLVQHSEMGASP
jgi:hypothetical protein